jgi:hypothetical protein
MTALIILRDVVVGRRVSRCFHFRSIFRSWTGAGVRAGLGLFEISAGPSASEIGASSGPGLRPPSFALRVSLSTRGWDPFWLPHDPVPVS